MNQQKSKKSIWWSIGIVVVAVIIYLLFFAGAPSTTDQNLLQPSVDANVGNQVLSLLNQIQSLKIDADFFNSPAYKSLEDHTVAIPPENVGRTNPFAPIPGFVLPKASNVSR